MTKKQIPAKASKKALAKDKNGTLEETVVTLLKKRNFSCLWRNLLQAV